MIIKRENFKKIIFPVDWLFLRGWGSKWFRWETLFMALRVGDTKSDVEDFKTMVSCEMIKTMKDQWLFRLIIIQK